jgi:cytochrome c oxidase assembly protein Cox11
MYHFFLIKGFFFYKIHFDATSLNAKQNFLRGQSYTKFEPISSLTFFMKMLIICFQLLNILTNEAMLMPIFHIG